MRGGVWAVCLAGFLLLWAAWPVAAQTSKIGDSPVLLTADEMSFNRGTGIVTAKGNVEISQGLRVLKADQLSYNQNTRVVKARGNVSLLEPTGEVIFTESVELSDDLREGVIDNIRVLFPDQSRFAANGAVRTGGNRTDMRKAVFSPCRLCEDDPTKPPLWQIKANRIVHDQAEQTVSYEDASMELFGVPVSYTPVFWHPDPTVKRKSGLLAPVFGTDANLGFTARPKYFVVLSDDWDATLSPIFATKDRPVAAGELRHRFRNGTLEAEGSITRAKKRDRSGDELGTDITRGHVFGKARYDIDQTWRLALDGALSSDDTYLRRYNISRARTLTGPSARADVLVSQAKLEGFMGRNYALARTIHFQGLREEDIQENTAFPLPFLEYSHVSQPLPWIGGRLTFDGSILNLFRQEGVNSRRFSAIAGWERRLVGPFGSLFTLSGSMEGDLYSVTDVAQGDVAENFNGVVARFYPQAIFDWRFPLVRELGNVRHLIEPRVALAVAPNGVNDARIPNEDSQDFEFDDTNLFAPNRFTGLDRVDDSQRLTYGVRTAFYGDAGGQTEIFVGQSFRFRNDDTFNPGQGIGDDFSDVVGRVTIEPSEYLDLNFRFRLDREEAILRRSLVSMSAGPQAFKVSANYLFFDEDTDLAEFDNREEVSGGIVAQVTENWSASARTTYDLSPRGGPLQYGGGVTYRDECLVVSLDFARNFTNDRDLKSSTEVFVRVAFKYLGEIGTSN